MIPLQYIKYAPLINAYMPAFAHLSLYVTLHYIARITMFPNTCIHTYANTQIRTYAHTHTHYITVGYKTYIVQNILLY